MLLLAATIHQSITFHGRTKSRTRSYDDSAAAGADLRALFSLLRYFLISSTGNAVPVKVRFRSASATITFSLQNTTDNYIIKPCQILSKLTR